jgi:hypothetical protein
MKKEYNKPSIKVKNVYSENILANSDPTVNNRTASEDNALNQFAKRQSIWQTE